MRLKTHAKPKAAIPTASMADIAFLLIIFFMVTTSHEVDRTSVNLPSSFNREEAEKGSAIVVLAKDPDGAMHYKFSDGKNMSVEVSGPEDIFLEAARLTSRDPQQQFVLKADGSVQFEKIDELLDSMRKGGVQKVLLLTGQRTAAGGGA